jgi:hypothetical protein
MLTKCRGMSHPKERAVMFPILKRASRVSFPTAQRQDLEVGICMTLSQIDREDDCLERASRLLAELPKGHPLRSDVFLARSCVLLRQGRVDAALSAAQDSVAAYKGRYWGPFGPEFQEGLALQRVGRTDDAVKVLCQFLSASAFTHVDYLGRAAVIVWKNGRQDHPKLLLRGIANLLHLHSGNVRWRVRMALLQLQLGQPQAAAQSLRQAAEGFGKKKRKRVHALADAVDQRSAEARPDLDAFVGELDQGIDQETLVN